MILGRLSEGAEEYGRGGPPRDESRTEGNGWKADLNGQPDSKFANISLR